MQPKVFVKKAFDRLYRYLWFEHRASTWVACRKAETSVAARNIWLLGIPRSTNIGDQAQVMCMESIFREQFPEYTIHEYDSVELMKDDCMLLDCIASLVKREDIVFFQSGYNLTDMYPFQEEMHREVVRRIRKNTIVFLPQTISFRTPYSQNAFVLESLSLYEKNENVYLMCRDSTSLEIAREALPGVKKLAFPDVVTSMVGRVSFQNAERHGVLLCVRRDEEGSFSIEDLASLERSLRQVANVTRIDTTVDEPSQFFIRKDRKKYVYKMLGEFLSSEVVVTDRYHGLIFSLATNTPVVLLRTIDHKMIGGAAWLPGEMRMHVRIADSIDEAVKLAQLMAKQSSYRNPDYFYEQYYSRLRFVLFDESGWEA